MACRIPGEGRVTVSLRRSMGDTAKGYHTLVCDRQLRRDQQDAEGVD
jgi:hypothetical protein